MGQDCFVIMPIRPIGSEEYDHFRALYEEVIRPPLAALGFNVVRADDSVRTGSITKEIVGLLASSALVVADITDLNPNVFYELGVRHTLRRRGTIILMDKSRTKIPFDLTPYRVIEFDGGSLKGAGDLRRQLDAFASALASDSAEEPEASDSPVHDWLQVLPADVVATAQDIADKLMNDGVAPDMPVAVLERGTLPGSRALRTLLADLGDLVDREKVKSPAIIVVGEVVLLSDAENRLRTLANRVEIES